MANNISNIVYTEMDTVNWQLGFVKKLRAADFAIEYE